MTKGPAPGSRAWQIQEFRKDLRACGQFATKREEARKLLAWKPQAPWVHEPGTIEWAREYESRRQQKYAQSRAELQNLNAELVARSARFQADETACLQGLDWPDEQIQILREVFSETTRSSLTGRRAFQP